MSNSPDLFNLFCFRTASFMRGERRCEHVGVAKELYSGQLGECGG